MESPAPLFEQVVIDITAAGVNRADVLQAHGHYSPPPEASDVLGLEVAGVVSAVGRSGSPFRVGDRVMALLDSGGYAEKVAVSEHLVLPIPDRFSFTQAAGIMEAACTVWSNLFDVGGLKPSETVLIHGGSGGVGSFAIQLAAARGAHVIAVARTPERVARCLELGAHVGFAYQDDTSDEPFTERLPHNVRDVTGGQGVDVILDVLGAAYLDAHLASLATGGRLVVIGLQKGVRGTLNLGRLLEKRASIHGTTLRSRPLEEKAALVDAVKRHVLPLLADGSITPIIHTTLPLHAAQKAHTALTSGDVFGKVVLTMPSHDE